MWDMQDLTRPTPTAPNAGKSMLRAALGRGNPGSPGTRVGVLPRPDAPDARGPIAASGFAGPKGNSTVLLSSFPGEMTLAYAGGSNKFPKRGTAANTRLMLVKRHRSTTLQAGSVAR
jgi:hypothetical protein